VVIPDFFHHLPAHRQTALLPGWAEHPVCGVPAVTTSSRAARRSRREHVRDVKQQVTAQVDLQRVGKCDFLTDGRYGWAVACEQAFGPGNHPVAICHEWNTIAHLSGYEGSPEARPFTRAELQRFLDYADEQVERAVRAKRKGALAAYRDATLFKVIYGWGLRRTETSKLDLADFGRKPGGCGVRPVRDAQRPVRQSQEGAAAAAP